MLKDDVDMEQLLLDEVEVTCLKKTVMYMTSMWIVCWLRS